MTRHVYFSFHYEQDILRANVVRNSSEFLAKYTGKSRKFFDDSLWEKNKKPDDDAIRRMINKGLEGTTVTCVLIGQQTWSRPWIRYEILKSFERGNGIFGVNIHDIPIQPGNQQQTNRGLLSLGLANKTNNLFGLPTNALAALLRKPLNPFDYLAVQFAGLLRLARLYEDRNDAWRPHPHMHPDSVNIENYRISTLSFSHRFSEFFSVHDWTLNNGHQNIAHWIEAAAYQASK